MSSYKPTDEQVAIRDEFRTGNGFVAEAGAGSGKTTTLRMLATDAPRRRGIYLAFGKANKQDAERTFPGSIKAMTSHGLAYGPVATRYINAGRKVNGPRVPAQEQARILRINEPVHLAKDIAPLAPQQLARIAVNTVGEFCKSGDDEIGAKHVPLLAGLEDRALRAELARAILPFAQRAWADIQSLNGRLRFEHNHYQKIYQLSRPRIRKDYLLVDEAQDLNRCVAALVAAQDHLQLVYVGDRCQAIYGWNGAVDAMETAPGKRLYLSQSFRFGDAIAGEANKWLSILHATLKLRGFSRIESRVEWCAAPDAILCRSNATALARVMESAATGRRTALVGNGDELRALAKAAIDLQTGRGTDHPELLAFTSWAAVQEYVDRDDSASDLRVLVKLIDSYSPATIVSTIDRLHPEEDAEVVISTAHKAKGREWHKVQIADDFREPKPREDGSPGRVRREDAMLAYVAVTRAQHVLDRTGLAWVDDYLPDPRFNPAEPTFGELLDASSLGTPEAVAMRARGRAAAAAELTGMPEEQADWDADDDQDDHAPADRRVHLDDGPFRTLCGLSLDSGVRFTTERASSDCRACTGTKPDVVATGHCYRCGGTASCSCGPAEAARWSELTGLPAGPKALATVGGRRG